jgi:hypothetical protein
MKIQKFEVRKLQPNDYKYNTEFEQFYINEFDSNFRAIVFEYNDFDVPNAYNSIGLRIKHFHIHPIENLQHFSEFNRLNKNNEMVIVVQYNDWENFKEFEFGFIDTFDIMEARINDI